MLSCRSGALLAPRFSLSLCGSAFAFTRSSLFALCPSCSLLSFPFRSSLFVFLLYFRSSLKSILHLAHSFLLSLFPWSLSLFCFGSSFFALRFPCSHSLFPLPSTPFLLAFALPSSFFVFSLHFRSFLFAFLSSLFPLAFAFAWAVRGHAVFSSNLLPFAGQQMHKRNMRWFPGRSAHRTHQRIRRLVLVGPSSVPTHPETLVSARPPNAPTDSETGFGLTTDRSNGFGNFLFRSAHRTHQRIRRRFSVRPSRLCCTARGHD